MSLVVDSSVVLKWVLPEPGRERALALIGEKALFAPDLLLVECADVLAVRAEQGRMSDAQAQAGLRLIRSVAGLLVRPGEPYIEAAQALALELRQSAHACLYLAMALAELGKKVLLLLRRHADWRWGRSRKDSYWYENVEIFRQQREGDWSPVVQVVAHRLATLVQEIGDAKTSGVGDRS